MGDVLVLHLQLDFPRQGGSQRTDFSLHHHLTIIFFFSLSHIFIQDFKASSFRVVSIRRRRRRSDERRTTASPTMPVVTGGQHVR